MIETISFRRERAATQSTRPAIATELHELKSKPLVEQVVRLLKSYSEDSSPRSIGSEAELIGSISGYIVGVDPSRGITPATRIGERYVADLVVNKGDDRVVVEVRRGRAMPEVQQAVVAKLLEYVNAARASGGVVFFSSGGSGTTMVKRVSVQDGTKELWVIGGLADGTGSA